MCVELCATSEDCTPEGVGGTAGGPPLAFVCERQQCRPEDGFPDRCVTDGDCVARASNWTQDCSASAECGAQMECVDVGGGTGKCAPTEDHVVFCSLLPDRVSLQKIDATGAVTVCASESQLCHPTSKICVEKCSQSADCMFVPGASICSSAGFCACSQNADCTASGFCHLETGLCGCDEASDCTIPGSAGSECIDGQCGCQSQNQCTGRFAGTTPSCQ
jgi:hypothetical protein